VIDLGAHSWPIARAGDVLLRLAHETGLPCKSTLLPQAPAPVKQGERNACRAWLESVATLLGLQVTGNR
jgi:hypothetical protein